MSGPTISLSLTTKPETTVSYSDTGPALLTLTEVRSPSMPRDSIHLSLDQALWLHSEIGKMLTSIPVEELVSLSGRGGISGGKGEP